MPAGLLIWHKHHAYTAVLHVLSQKLLKHKQSLFALMTPWLVLTEKQTNKQTNKKKKTSKNKEGY